MRQFPSIEDHCGNKKCDADSASHFFVTDTRSIIRAAAEADLGRIVSRIRRRSGQSIGIGSQIPGPVCHPDVSSSVLEAAAADAAIEAIGTPDRTTRIPLDSPPFIGPSIELFHPLF